ncbi:MAG: caspase family protein [Rhodospirillales bacterium]|nr:caspase family protein [Rhodospirillales bacterium]
MSVHRFTGVVLLLVFVALLTSPAAAGWHQNSIFGYRVHFPDNWSVEADPDGTIVKALKPDSSIQLVIQVGDLPGQVRTPNQLADAYTANVFDELRLLKKQNDALNGIPMVTAVYLGQDGPKQILIGAFYMVQPPYAFVLYSVMDAKRAQQLANESDAVFKSFSRVAPSAPTMAAKPPVPPAPAPAPAPAAEPPLDPIDAPFVVVSKARVRARPDVRAKSVTTLKAGEEITVLGRVTGTKWMLVARDDDALGYVVERSLRDKTATVAQAPAPAAAPAPAIAVTVPKGVQFGRYFALVIGNTGYKNFPALVTAGDDANAVAALLGQSYGYKTQLLLDATRNQIIDAIEGYREKLGANDNLLIYYAGHGWLDKKAERGYWLPVDARPNSKANWVSNTTITDSIKAMDAKHVMVVADSCYSGTLTRGIKIKRRDSEYFKRLAKTKARIAMTSGGLEPVSDSGGGGHSAFAKAFLDVLAKNDGVLDGTELFKRIERPVKLNADQTPAYSDIRKAGHEEGGDFLFVRRN